MTQQLSHAVVMLARRFDEESPELAALGIKHAQLERDAQKRCHGFETVILVRFGKILRRALQRLERAAVILAWLVNRTHDSLITGDEFLDVHLRNEVDGGDRVVSRGIGAEQPAFTFESLPQLRVRKRVEHSHHRHRNRAFTNELDLAFENVFRVVIEADDKARHYFHAATLYLAH